MELYEYARPGLMAGKKILYVHGFASSGQNGSVKTLRLLMPQAKVIAPDLPVEPSDAMELLRNKLASEKPDIIIGTSMGAMYTEMLYGVDRILVNPAFQLADTLLKNNGLGRQEYHNPRQDGETSFLVTKTLLEHFREVSSHCFERAAEDHDKVFGLYGIHDTLVHTFDLFSEHYPQAIRFDGEHYLNDNAILHSVMPVIQWIDDRQRNVQKPVLFISLSDRIINHSSGFAKSVATLAANYDVHIVASVPYNTPE
ncbi:MAG TPA: esterase, partial [Rikenellaceae bacterium]|nr:esterase [Rikenellaceae bacterium]